MRSEITARRATVKLTELHVCMQSTSSLSQLGIYEHADGNPTQVHLGNTAVVHQQDMQSTASSGLQGTFCKFPCIGVVFGELSHCLLQRHHSCRKKWYSISHSIT